MSKEDLIPIKTHERAVELGRKGGQARSKAKSFANKLKALKRTKDSGKILVYYEQLVLDPQLSASEIYRYITELWSTPTLTVDEKIKLITATINVHKIVHGEKIMNLDIVKGDIVVRWENERE